MARAAVPGELNHVAYVLSHQADIESAEEVLISSAILRGKKCKQFTAFASLLTALLIFVGTQLGQKPTGLPSKGTNLDTIKLATSNELPMPVEDYTEAVLAIIEEEFSALNGKSGSVDPDVPAKNMDDYMSMPKSWEVCASVDYMSFDGLDNAKIQHQIKALGLERLCDKGDATCDAFRAGYKVMMRVRETFSQPALMQNYTLVNWYENRYGYPSWGSDVNADPRIWGPMVELHYAKLPPVAIVHDPHAADGYAFCEIAHTILQQSNSQFFASCGPTAVLAALITRSPVQAFKKALQIYYTGTLPAIGTRACPYVFDQQPGIIPFRQDMPGGEEYMQIAEQSPSGWCPGSQQASSYVKDGQCQAVGIQRMWVSALLAAHEHEIITDRAGDDECLPTFQSVYPGQKHGRDADDIFRTPPATIVWACDAALGDGKPGTCKYISTAYEICSQKVPGTDCPAVLNTDWALQDLRPLQDALMHGMPPAELTSDLAQRPTMKPILDLIPGETSTEKMSKVALLFQVLMTASDNQSANSDMFIELCAGKAAMLNMAPSALFNEMTDDKNCAHWILLESCHDDHYVVWSSGFRIEMTKATLESSTCGGVVWEDHQALYAQTQTFVKK